MSDSRKTEYEPVTFEEQQNFARFVEIYSQTLRKLIVFCGAGASLEAGFPDWDGLIDGLEREMDQPVFNQIGDSILQHRIDAMRAETDPWKKIEIASEFLEGGYETAISNILKGRNDNIPTFYKHVWDLRLAGLITMNLDGLAAKGYTFSRKAAPTVHTGQEAFTARNVFTSKEPTIIELHGNINKPQSWILRDQDFQKFSETETYKNFLRGVFSQNLVLIYGLSEGDSSVSAQLRYLKDIRSANGEYFVVKKWPSTEQDRRNFRDLGIQYIYIPSYYTWEEGITTFISKVKNFVKEESEAEIVSSKLSNDDAVLPDPTILMAYEPDRVRLLLARVSGQIAKLNNGTEELEKFKQKYDWAINHANRVRLGTSNDKWLEHQLQEEQGSGNFGRVFSALSPTGNNVAIKIAHEAVRDNDAMLNSFRRGVQSMRRLTKKNIPGIVSIIDASELPPSIIMEFVDGINVEQAIDRGLIHTPSEVIRIHIFICEIIFSCHTHESGILHRDLRPQNVMIDGEYWAGIEKEQIKVLDFDLSWYEGATGQDYYMASAAALGYLAPEQLDKKSSQSTRTALVDVYGLSMLLYFMLSHQHPQAAAAERVNWSKQLDDAVAKIYSKNWSICGEYVKNIIMEGTSHEQINRPALTTLIEKLKIASDMLENRFINDASVIMKEIVRRSFGKVDLDFTGKRIKGITLTGVSFEFQHRAENKSINIELHATAADSAPRQAIAKYLNEALERARDIANSIGTVDRKNTQVGQSRNRIVFDVEMPKDLKEVDSLSKNISRISASLKVK